MKTLYIFAGGNGAGKTTTYRGLRDTAFEGMPFINADLLLKQATGENDPRQAHIGQELAQQRLKQALSGSESFVFETVFSHDSKLELMKLAMGLGFRVEIYFIHVEYSSINIDRVRRRVEAGGHDVPIEKIRARIPRTLRLVKEALKIADGFLIFDNTEDDSPAKVVAGKQEGQVTFGGLTPEWALRLISSDD